MYDLQDQRTGAGELEPLVRNVEAEALRVRLLVTRTRSGLSREQSDIQKMESDKLALVDRADALGLQLADRFDLFCIRFLMLICCPGNCLITSAYLHSFVALCTYIVISCKSVCVCV